jgi:NodT family efflux transporter outer membrane factor (OMF) lipoprotein
MIAPFLRAGLALGCALVAGCAGMNGLAPQATSNDPNALGAHGALSSVRVTDAAWPAGDWWKSFRDPQLDALMSEALASNPTLDLAAARTRKALALAEGSRSALSPRVDASASTALERFPEHGLVPPPFGGTMQTLSDLQLSLSWEIDFWGKNRAVYEAALGAARAAEVDAYATRLALSTNIAQAYVQLLRAYLQLDVAKQTLASRERIAALTRDRNAAGIDSRLEVKQAEAALPATREEIAALEERIALARNAIAALMGAGPDRGLAIVRPTATASAQVALPSTLPAELIGRRPDIVAQRWRIEAASQDIASQKASFYPNVNLLAFAGVQGLAGTNLLSAASRTLGVAPAVTLPIFDAGRLRAGLAAKDADYDMAVGQYNQLLANAMRDVVDQVASFRSLDAQRTQQRIAAAPTREAYDLALLRYREGLGNYLQVLSAEQPLLAQQSLAADLHVRALELSINLVRALGGGYDPNSVATQVSMTTGQKR